MSCWSLGSISLRVGLPRAGEGSVVCWEGILQVRTGGAPAPQAEYRGWILSALPRLAPQAHSDDVSWVPRGGAGPAFSSSTNLVSPLLVSLFGQDSPCGLSPLKAARQI